MIRWVLAIALGLMLLAGCAVTEIPAPVSTADFARSGRFAVQSQRFNQNPENSQGGFAWQDRGNTLLLDLISPMGGTLARVSVNSREAVLTRSNGETISATSPDELIQIAIGQNMPVSDLRDWLRGRLSKHAASTVRDLSRDELGHLTGFTQDGWQVNLSKYDGLGPRAIALRRDLAGQQLSIRLIVD
ncbi:outer membrane lipoprotein LolB [Jezberella montanilacus]|nr:outer membrane lipoprotein LolB [Jezberella montanilacus]